MRLSHASKALLTFHWEIYCLREVVSIWALLPIYILPYTTAELKGLGVLVFKILLAGWIFCYFWDFYNVPLQKELRRAPYFPGSIKNSSCF